MTWKEVMIQREETKRERERERERELSPGL